MTSDAQVPLADRLQALPGTLLRAGVLAAPLVALAGMFALAGGTDECFLLLHIRGLAEQGQIGAGSFLHSSHTLATSGPYTMIVCLLHWVGKGSLHVIRFMSPLALAAVLLAILKIADRTWGGRGPHRWFAAAGIFLAHGTFLLASQAYGEVLAMALLFWAILLWATLPQGSWLRRLGVGAVLGMTVACRLNCAPVVAAIAVTWFGAGEKRRTEFKDILLTQVVAVVTFAMQWGLFLRFAHDPLAPSEWKSDFGMDVPLSVPWGYVIPEKLCFFIIGQDLFALFVIVGITAVWAGWARRIVADARYGDMLAVFAWLEWLAWQFKGPSPHIRYIWPALAAFAALGGLCLSAAHRAAEQAGSARLRTVAGIVALTIVAAGYLEAARMYLHGESDTLSWEFQRATRQSLQYGPFKQLQAQRAMVRRLRDLPPTDDVATLTLDTALAYETRRPIVPIQCYTQDQFSCYLPHPFGEGSRRRPRWIVINPMVNRFPSSQFTPKLHDWMARHCRLESRFGPYLLYEIQGPFPDDAGIFILETWEPSFPQVPGSAR